METEEKEMYGFARTLLYSAGTILKQKRNNTAMNVREKTSPMDLVTDHDLAVEQHLIACILARYPGHGIISEESRARAGSDRVGYTWIIDPIDGTVNFYRFGKEYAISLALYRFAEPVFGFVYDVAAELMFSAGKGQGAVVNGNSRRRRKIYPESLAKAVVAISCRTMTELAGQGMDVLGMLSGVQAHRYLGCASLELCKVAAGEYDLFISSTVYTWDVAAARIFLEETGGTFLYGNKKGEPVVPADSGSSKISGCGDREVSCPKLLVAAFHSPAVWEEALPYFPQQIRDAFSLG